MTRSAFFLAAFLLFGSPQHDARTIASALESRYQHARTLKAVFFQSYSDGKGSLSAESGTVYFSRPGRMRWEYESPEPKLFLVDGANVWFYVPSDHTATRAKLNESSDWRTPLALLAGKADLAKLCSKHASRRPSRLATSQRRRPATPFCAASPRKPCQARPSATFSLRSIRKDFSLASWSARPATRPPNFASPTGRKTFLIPEVKFHFEPPPGVAVVNEEALAGTIR